MTRDRQNKYRINSGNTLAPSVGETAFVRGGIKPTVVKMTISYGGFTWKSITHHSLTGYVNGRVFNNRDDALKECIRITRCQGVTRERKNRFRLNTGKVAEPSKNRQVWIKGPGSVNVAGATWEVVEDEFSTHRLDKKDYKNRRDALRSCKKNKKCKGVVKTDAGVYYLVGEGGKSKRTGYTLITMSGESVSWSGYVYSYTVDYIYVTIVDKRIYTTVVDAGRACARNPHCKAVNKIGPHKFQ